MRILYFIIFYNYIEKYSINKNNINYKEFSKQLNIETASLKAISKKFNIIIIKIMKKLIKYRIINKWALNLLLMVYKK